MQRITLYLFEFVVMNVFQIMDYVIIPCKVQDKCAAVQKAMINFDGSGRENHDLS